MMLGLMQALAYLIVGLAFGAELTAGVGGFFVIIALSVCVPVAFGTIGLFAALRTGSGEAVQGLFPVFFVFLFLSSMSLPLNLIQTNWFHTVASINPVSYLLQAFRSLLIEGWEPGKIALGFGIALGIGTLGMLAASSGLLAQRPQLPHQQSAADPGADLPALLLRLLRGRALRRRQRPRLRLPDR